MTRNLLISLLTFLLAVTFSCESNNVDPTALELLNSSTWLGSIEREMIGYDSDNKVIIQLTDATPEGQYDLITLNDDKTALIKYQCSKTSCLGKEYQGKWTLTNNDLKVTLNREQFHSLADAIFIEANIFRINAAEMILQRTTYDQAPSATKKVVRIKYIRHQP